jgi:hypothetical protein
VDETHVKVVGSSAFQTYTGYGPSWNTTSW